jgi:hypothetical protein
MSRASSEVGSWIPSDSDTNDENAKSKPQYQNYIDPPPFVRRVKKDPDYEHCIVVIKYSQPVVYKTTGPNGMIYHNLKEVAVKQTSERFTSYSEAESYTNRRAQELGNSGCVVKSIDIRRDRIAMKGHHMF